MKRIYFLLMFIPAVGFGADYAGLSVGSSLYDIDFPGVEHGYDSENSQSTAVYIGRTYGDHFAAEMEYAELGTFWIRNTDHETDATISALSLSGLSHFGPAFVKVGAEYWMLKATFNGHPEGVNGFGLVYGVGADIPLGNASLRVGFDKHVGIDDQRVDVNPGVTRFSIGLKFNLGE
jgi:hypothetical protein